MSIRLEGKVAIVTGAASGVGQAIARRFAEEGARVMLADSGEGSGCSEAAVLRDEGCEVDFFACDVKQRLDINNLLAATIDTFGRVDVVVNTVIQTDGGDALTLSEAEFDRVMSMNLKCAFLLSQAAARRMISQAAENGAEGDAGVIVNISSIAAQATAPELLAFSVSCAGLDQLTRSLAVALAPHRIRVNGVAPGGVMTMMLRRALRDVESLRELILARTPLRRIGEAEEAAAAALFLASSEASYVTGQILAVDGGRLALDPIAAPNL